MKHTPEPWPEVEEYDCQFGIPDIADFTTKPDADRARACVNACKGIATPGDTIPEAFDLLEELLYLGTPSPEWIRRAVKVVDGRVMT